MTFLKRKSFVLIEMLASVIVEQLVQRCVDEFSSDVCRIVLNDLKSSSTRKAWYGVPQCLGIVTSLLNVRGNIVLQAPNFYCNQNMPEHINTDCSIQRQNHGSQKRGAGGLPSFYLDFEIWHFPIKYSAKKGFLVSSGIIEIPPFLAFR